MGTTSVKSNAVLMVKGDESKPQKVENSVLKTTPKARIKAYKINPELHGKKLLPNSPVFIQTREKALSLGIALPDWNVPIHAPAERSLSDAHRQELINSVENIWFDKATDDDKESFLNVVEMALTQHAASEKYYPTSATPDEQSKSLHALAKRLGNTKKELGKLGGMPYQLAQQEYFRATFESGLTFGEVPSDYLMEDMNNRNFDLVLLRAWAHLYDIEKTLKSAATKIKKGKSNRPKTKVNNDIIERLAKAWLTLSGTIPPYSKEGTFFRFLKKLEGLLDIGSGIKFTDTQVESVVKKIKEASQPPV
jgi:hypothetical protein